MKEIELYKKLRENLKTTRLRKEINQIILTKVLQDNGRRNITNTL